MKKSIAYAAVVAAGVSLGTLAAPAQAAKPAPPGPMSVVCYAAGYSYPRWAEAFNAPKGTKQVSFTFWNTVSDYQTLNYYSGPNAGTDFSGRDGWMMFSDYPSAVVVATAWNGRSVELGSAVGYC